MTMNDSDVRLLLQRATAHLDNPPALLDQVRQGGRQRVVRRRSVLAAGLAVVAAASLGGTVQLAGRDGPAEVASPLFDQPTRGNLAADQVYLRKVTQLWRRHLDRVVEIAVLGEPHVVWAGSTPAGPAPARSRSPRSSSRPLTDRGS